ncbi:MAG: tetratricopeptide repeat protein [Syntrophobacterales bacterium]
MVVAKLLARFSWCWIVLFYLSGMAQPVAAAERADLLWNFAGHLYQEQDFYRALSEYQRFLFLFPTDPRVPKAELQIGRCYRREGKFQKAFSHLIRLHNRRAEEPVGRQALLEMVAIREEQGRYPEAIYWAQQFIERYPDYAEIDAVYVHLAWLQIDSGKFEEAIATLELLPPESTHYPRARSLQQALKQRPETAKKSPAVAGTLSAVLPGAGHLYTGRPGQAASSFLLNALFIAGAVLAFQNDSPVLGGILVFFELGWYTGGIRSAAQAAREENEKQERKFRRELKERYRLSLGLEPGKDRMALSVRLSF